MTALALAQQLMRRWTESDGDAAKALMPLVDGTLQNVRERKVWRTALTGPVSRGDAGTVVKHLAVMPAELIHPYCAFGRAAADLALKNETITAQQHDELTRILAMAEGVHHEQKVTNLTIKKMKQEGTPISMITAYDYIMAQNVDEAGIDMILVGDSLGNVVMGHTSTLPVTMEDMIHHTAAVVRGVKRALVVGDMPFMSYQESTQQALHNAGRLMKETGCDAVKLEGGASVCEAVKAMTTAGIPVVGHIGLTPQSVHQLGGFRVQGKNSKTAKQLIADALKLEAAGAFAITLECVPTDIATEITKALHTAATIGIGAGNGTDGQVLVCTDLLGMSSGFRPKFVKTYADLHQTIVDAVGQYIHDVKDRSFPDEAHGFAVDPEVVKAMKE